MAFQSAGQSEKVLHQQIVGVGFQVVGAKVAMGMSSEWSGLAFGECVPGQEARTLTKPESEEGSHNSKGCSTFLFGSQVGLSPRLRR